MAEKPILDLSTLEPDRPKIRVDGKLYEMAVMDDFGLRDQHWFASRGRQIGDALDRDELDDDAAEMLDDALTAYIRRIVPSMPEDLVRKLNFNQQVQIIEVFGRAGPAMPRGKASRATRAT